ncbi:MAG: hypothetical protein MN733_25540 [Nitrososphaera sp.]|nr:hypothetical protein [Nitrososphaera sp.]
MSEFRALSSASKPTGYQHSSVRTKKKGTAMPKQIKSEGLTEVKVDFSEYQEEQLKDVFPARPLGYSELLDHLWAFIEKHGLSSEPFRSKRGHKHAA